MRLRVAPRPLEAALASQDSSLFFLFLGVLGQFLFLIQRRVCSLLLLLRQLFQLQHELSPSPLPRFQFQCVLSPHQQRPFLLQYELSPLLQWLFLFQCVLSPLPQLLSLLECELRQSQYSLHWLLFLMPPWPPPARLRFVRCHLNLPLSLIAL